MNNDTPIVTCRKHRRYRALRHPRTTCETCWIIWIARIPLLYERVVKIHTLENTIIKEILDAAQEMSDNQTYTEVPPKES